MLSAQFKDYLLSLSNSPSRLTIKNYVSDINKFLRWYKTKLNRDFQPEDVSRPLIESFKRDSLVKYSASSVDRSLSSLRKFFHFLKIEGKISHSPFEQLPASAEDLVKLDPFRLREFKNHLYVFNASHLTIKNYIIDLKQFLNWVERVSVDENSWEVSREDIFSKLSTELIEEYKKRLLSDLRLSPVSVNRKLSSIRRYISWARQEGLISKEAPKVSQVPAVSQPGADQPLAEKGATRIQIPSDTPDTSDTSLASRTYSSFPPLRLAQKTKNGIVVFFDRLLTYPLADLLENFEELIWIIKRRPVFTNRFSRTKKQINTDLGKSVLYPRISNIPKGMYAPTKISTKYLPLHKKIWHHARHTRPKWYKKYHSYTFVSYLHFSILMLFISIFGYILFDSFKPEQKPAVLAALPSAPPRILSFQGRLTDASDNPITTQTTLRMAIYNNETASGAALLWQEVVSPTPDKDGIFSIILGKNTSIPQSLFSQNSALWLGVTVGQTPELTPRHQIATVAYAANAETLQGLPPITNSSNTSNVVLALNSSGNLTIGDTASPTFQATGGTFTLSGKAISITTVSSSNGNIVIKPDGTGIIDLQKALQNTSNSNSLIAGAVEVDDLFAILGSTASQAILSITQNSTGDLIMASVSGNTKFRVNNSGTITNSNWNGTKITSTYGGNGIDTSGSTGVPFVSSGTWSIDTNYLYAIHGGTGQTSYSVGDILYASSSSTLARLGVGTSTQCLIGGTTPSYGSCTTGESFDIFWNQSSGALFPNNSTVDLLVGGQASSSAKFGVLNINSGTPTASISANSGNIATYLTGLGQLSTTNRQTLTIGNSSTNNTTGNVLINSNGVGLVAIGTTTPTSALYVTHPLAAGVTGQALAIFDQIENQDIFTASASGTTRFVIQNGGDVGIGVANPLFKLDLSDSQSASAAAQIFNSDTGTDADGIIIKLGNSSTTAVSTTNHFLSFETSGIGIVGSIQGNGGKNVAYVTNGIADFAEYMKKDPSEHIEWGSIICQNTNGKIIPCNASSSNIIGVASEFPTFVGGQDLGNSSITVGLTGIVLTRVSNQNGKITSGDYITSSDSGIGVKANNASFVVGIALENYDSQGVGKILVRIAPSWYDPGIQLADTGDLLLTKNIDDNFEVQRDGRTIDRIGAFSDLVVARIKSGYFETGKLLVTGSISVKNLTSETLASTMANFSQLSADSLAVLSEELTIGGQNIRDYITLIVNDAISNIQYPISNSEIVKTNIISPLSDDEDAKIAIKLNDSSGKSKLEIQNSSGSAVASFDSSGNASFSGKLATNELTTNTLSSQQLEVSSDATISGTLRASRIVAEQLELSEETLLSLLGLESQSSTSATTLIIPNLPNATISADGQYVSTGSASFDNLFALKATFEQGLLAFGPSSFFELSVADRLFVGSQLSLADRSINVLGGNLELQPLKQGGIAFVGGEVEIDTEGNLKVNGNAYFAKNVEVNGKLSANIISPLSDKDIVLNLTPSNQRLMGSSDSPKFTINNSSGSAVLTINSQGNLSASGAGTFNKLNLNVVNEALAISPTEVIATGSAGVAQISPNRSELTIRNPFVTEDSLIYITPKTATPNQSVYLLRQVPGESFTVGISQPVNKKVPFNWILIN